MSDHYCSTSDTIALPEQSDLVRGLRRTKKQCSVDVGQIARIGPITGNEDVLNELGPRCRSITFPQLVASGAVIGAEKQSPIEVRQVARVRVVARPRANIQHQFRADRRTIAFPEFM